VPRGLFLNRKIMAKEKENIFIKSLKYFKESREELKKVSWLKTNEAFRLTVIVIIISAIVALFLGFFDYIFNESMNLIIK